MTNGDANYQPGNVRLDERRFFVVNEHVQNGFAKKISVSPKMMSSAYRADSTSRQVLDFVGKVSSINLIIGHERRCSTKAPQYLLAVDSPSPCSS